ICTSPLVEIGLKGPPVGAPGLRSHMSIVDGPPPIHSMMAALCRFFRLSELAAMALVNEIAGSANADAPAMCCRKCRRLMPAGRDARLMVFSERPGSK